MFEKSRLKVFKNISFVDIIMPFHIVQRNVKNSYKL